MGHPLRMYEASDWWFITARCCQARKLMTPHTPLVRDVCGGVLARAAEKYEVKVYAYVFMSNHLHLVVGARGNRFAEFLKYLFCNLSRKLAPLCRSRWWGPFWERRASVAPILDTQALEDRVRYVLSHGVKEGLVRRAREWEGLHCAEQLLDGNPRAFRWLNWTRRWNAKGRVGFGATVGGRYEDEWAESVELKLTPLPQWEGKPVLQRARVLAILKEEETRKASELRAAGKAAMGMQRVKGESAEPPRWRKRSSRPWCHAASREDFGEYCRQYRAFRRAFRLAAEAWLAGDVSAMFPAGCFRPYVAKDVTPNIRVV